MLRRREFLQSVAAVASTQMIPKVLFALPTRDEGEVPLGALTAAAMIWPVDSVVVPLLKGGHAASIASSGNGAQPGGLPDLHAAFVKEIRFELVPEKVLLHLFAFTRYRLSVNGVAVGRGPCRYQNARPEYDTREIAKYLRVGVNRIAVLVHRDAPTGRIMAHDPGFAAVMEWKDAGRTRKMVTDASWLAMAELSFGPRAQAWASIEEHIDARRMEDWEDTATQVVAWKQAGVVSPAGAITVWPREVPLQTEVERPWEPSIARNGFDLVVGQPVSLEVAEILQGFHTLELETDAGSVLEVRYDLPQGEKSGVCTYTARQGRQTYTGGDTFALRRLTLTLRSGRMHVLRAAVTEVRYPLERVASFESSDAFLNQLWRVCARSLEVLSEDAYVDCADRERVEWTDCSPPAFDCTRVMMRGPDAGGKTYWGDNRLAQGLLRRIALTQQPDGQLKAHSCSERFDIHAIMEDRTCGWVVLLREYYESSMDAKLVRELWPTLLTLMSWYRTRRTARGLVQAREWEVWDNPLRYQVCEGAGLNAMVHRALVDAAYLGKAVGFDAEASALALEAVALQRNFNVLLWDETAGAYSGALFGPDARMIPQPRNKELTGLVVDGRYGPTAQANLFAFYGGLVPAERVGKVRRWVLAHSDEVREPMSHYYLFRMLYAMEEPQRDAAVLQLMRTGWKNQVDSEWQTGWEDLEKTKGSKVHVYGMVPGYFLTAFVLGARREGPISIRELVLEPRCSGLKWARGGCVTEFGLVTVDWSDEAADSAAGGLRLQCMLPKGVRTRLLLPVRGEMDTVLVDGISVRGTRRGTRLEVILGEGTHLIRYGVGVAM
jgi:alpha-L-rhamnosidase